MERIRREEKRGEEKETEEKRGEMKRREERRGEEKRREEKRGGKREEKRGEDLSPVNLRLSNTSPNVRCFPSL